MSPDERPPNAKGPRWARVRAITDAALELPHDARQGYVESACGSDVALRREVERLLDACARAERTPGFLGEPASIFAAPILEALNASGETWQGQLGTSSFGPLAGESHDALVSTLQSALDGRYTVEREVGRGGMARVYLAYDVRHGRRVALKVLSPELRVVIGVERFLAEIKVTAGLQHPNLLPLFDSGEAAGLLYYVMPYVEGESLRTRLRRERQLPIDEAVRLATAIAGALDYAHRSGVVHRDLKPENILLHEGEPLVADFGIALALSKAGGARLTQSGPPLGTPAYMSPEQAAADRQVDARSDVYSLGCVLYEMLTGDPPHTGSSVQTIIAKVLNETPLAASALRGTVSPALEAVVAKALAKLPADRFATARDFADALGAVNIPGSGKDQLPTVARRVMGARQRRLRDPLVLALWLLVAVGLTGAAWLWGRQHEARSARTTRFVAGSFTGLRLGGSPTITPDGRRLVYTGPVDSGSPLMVRTLDELDGHPLPGVQDAVSAFISPDGRWVGFFTSDDKLKKVPIEGGAPTLLAGAFRFSRARWGANGVIVTDAYGHPGLSWLPDSGGALRRLTQLDTAAGELAHRAPLILPDGKSVVFTVERHRGGPSPVLGEFAVAPLDTRAGAPVRHTLLGVRGRRAVGVVDDWLLFTGSDGFSIMAVRFDTASGRSRSTPIPVLEEHVGTIEGVELSGDGTLVYTRRSRAAAPVLVDVTGASQPLLSQPNGEAYMNPRFSPDGRQLALQSESPLGSDVWVVDLASRTSTRLTSSGNAFGPAWAPDGRRVVFLSSRSGRDAFWWQVADGTAPPEKLVEIDGLFAGTLTPDGRTLLFQRQQDNVWGIWAARLDGDRTPYPVLKEPFDDYMPVVSPDGGWLAYTSTASGKQEIYVRSFPRLGAPVQISEGGGTEPMWARDGRRLFYRGSRQIVGAELTTAPAMAVTSRTALFADAFDGGMPHTNYDVTPDGKRFLMMTAQSDTPPETVIVLNWIAELRGKLTRSR